jgi:hypothetical protein
MQARCRQCGARFTIPEANDPESDVYALEASLEEPARSTPASPAERPVFVPSRVAEPSSSEGRRRKKREETESLTPMAQSRGASFPWQTWLIRSSAALLISLVVIALVLPQGTLIAGCILLALGGLLVLLGYLAGAYGAFCEDFLYGFLYVMIPLYAGYYIVTRWDDLWVWFTCATVGVGLVFLGTEIVRWAGVSV